MAKAKERITITIDKNLLKWLDGKIDSRLFANRSHGFEFLTKKKIKDEINAASLFFLPSEK